jgi:hypothetical protein
MYLNDIIIYLEDPFKYELHIRKVLERLCKAKPQVDIKKSEFNITCIKFLGFIISTNSIKVDPEKVIVIKN